MAAAVLGVRFAGPDSWPVGVRLATQAGSGVAVYAAVLYYAHRTGFWTS